MPEHTDQITDVRPKIRRRACGGWLAVCPINTGFSFGVTAPTEREVRDEFRFVFNRWLETIRDRELAADT